MLFYYSNENSGAVACPFDIEQWSAIDQRRPPGLSRPYESQWADLSSSNRKS